MLDARCVLRFIHADIRVLLLKICECFRTGLQNIQRVAHLVVIIHQPFRAEFLCVCAVEISQAEILRAVQLIDLFL